MNINNFIKFAEEAVKNTCKYAHTTKIAKSDLKDIAISSGIGIGTASIINAIRNLLLKKNLSRKDKILNLGRDALIGGLIGAAIPFGYDLYRDYDSSRSLTASDLGAFLGKNLDNPFHISNSDSPFGR